MTRRQMIQETGVIVLAILSLPISAPGQTGSAQPTKFQWDYTFAEEPGRRDWTANVIRGSGRHLKRKDLAAPTNNGAAILHSNITSAADINFEFFQ